MVETLKEIGWREWVALPDLGIKKIKAKIDTGARTSALHAFDVQLEREHGEVTVFFQLHPRQKNDQKIITCRAPLIDRRDVRDSGGHTEQRFVIATRIVLGAIENTAELTLTDRDSMGFRMLVGRTAIRGTHVVNPERSYLLKQD